MHCIAFLQHHMNYYNYSKHGNGGEETPHQKWLENK